MKKILGLDLGTNSIGWALIEVDDNNKPIKIIALGSRIIPINSDERDQFEKGQSISKNQERTKSRTQRKGYDRKQLKKKDLKIILEKLGIYPTNELLNIPFLDLWKLRSESANPDSNISAKQLGRILYMLNQKRGYKSARREANADKKETEYVAAVKSRYNQIQDKGQTIGQYFYEKLSWAYSNNEYYRIKEKVLPREAYEKEFDTIINVQKEKHDFLTDDIIDQIKNETIYFQRKLKSQKGLISICDFEGFEKKIFNQEKNTESIKFVGPRVAAKTSPLNQFCKVWETVNNISLKIKNPEGSKYKWGEWFPTLEEKQKIADYLNTHENLSFQELLKIVNLKKENIYVNKQILKGLQGNLTYSELENTLGSDSPLLQFNISIKPLENEALLVDKKTGEILEERVGLIVENTIEQQPLYQLWHTIYSIKDLDECKKALIKRYNVSPEIADKLSKIDFNKQAFASKSNKAIRKILPHLMQGFDYSQACSLAGYNHSNSLTKEERDELTISDKLELLKKNSLRQPVVEKILNQMINVVNAVFKEYGNPEEIRVELARELKQSKDERNEADKKNASNKRLNEEVIKRLKELGLPTTKRYIQKYKFIFPVRDKKITEAHVVNQCIYCGLPFNITEALSGDNFDVDHIVPKALLFDDSQTNKVLVHRSCNATKTSQTAYDYIDSKGEDALNQYVKRVDDWYVKGVISYSKMERLKVSYKQYVERKKQNKETESDKKLWENFIDRQLRETQYISRKACEILQQVCKHVTTTEGTVTASIRRLWGWDDVLMNLQLPKYREYGQTQMKEWTSENGRRKHSKEEIINWTKRDDHRHHAIDALVIACTKQGYIQRINTLSSDETKDEMNRVIEEAKKKYGKEYDENILNETNEIVKNHSGKLSKLEEYLIAEKPFKTREVEQRADEILASFKTGKKVATISKYKATGKNKITGVIVPRGALHEQFIYGRIKVVDKDKAPKYLFENPEKIIDKTIRKKIEERLIRYNNDVKEAIVSLKKEPILIDEKKEKVLLKASCYKEVVVIKYPIQSIKAKDVPFIVDKKVRAIIKEKLDQFNGNEKEAFKDTVWYNEEKKIPILTVRCFTGLSSIVPVKKNENGKYIGFVIPGNNHHIAIYKDGSNKYSQHSCTLWHAVERKKYKLPIIIKDTREMWNSILDKSLPQSFLDNLPSDGLELVHSMQKNETYILGMVQDEFEQAMKDNNKSLLSKYLYLVWSVSENNYWYRHHLETKNTDLKKTEGARESKRYYLFKSVGAFLEKNPIKVRINHLGEIVHIGEY